MRVLLSSLLFVATVCALPQPLISFERGKTKGLIASRGNTTESVQVSATVNKIIPVIVGGTQDTFVPNVVTATVGDIIQFQFSNGNHTVTQSAENAACQPLQATVATAIHSGHIPFQDGQKTVGTFNMPVTSTDAMFLYCATGPHCQEGQVMVINPANNEQVLKFSKLAAGAPANIDGTTVVGGTVGQIPLEAALFTPATPQAKVGGPAPAADPVASGNPTTTAPASVVDAVTSTTRTIIITLASPI